VNHEALYQQFGRFLKAHRLQKGLSQEQLALRLGLSRTSITNIERGRQKVLLHQVFEIAAALEITPEALIPTVAQVQTSEQIERILAQVTDKLPELRDLPELQEWVARVIGSPVKTPAPESPSPLKKDE